MKEWLTLRLSGEDLKKLAALSETLPTARAAGASPKAAKEQVR